MTAWAPRGNFGPIEVIDLRGDGREAVFSLESNDWVIQFFENSSDGLQPEGVPFDAGFGGGGGVLPTPVHLDDLNRDGLLDLVLSQTPFVSELSFSVLWGR